MSISSQDYASQALPAGTIASGDAGAAVVCVSSELEEILKISDRIAVTAGGQFAGQVACARAVFKANCDKMRGRLFGEGGNLWSKHTILRQSSPPLLLF
jgi:ABC-type glutathione transport system ATPase component